MAEQEEDFSQLPLPDRFVHKNWKVRKSGYEDAAKEFEKTPDESDPVFRPFLQDPSLWGKAAGDSNVAAQQDGLSALCAFLKYGGVEACRRARGSTITPIYEKGLSSTRPAAKASALEALLLYVELDKSEPLLEELLPAFSHKQPKVIAAALAATTAIYHNFGCKVVEYKPVLKVLPKVFGHADKNVRAEATNLTAELYRWLKEAMKAVFWNDLKPVQQQDLEKLFEKVKEEPPPKQERFTRTQQAAMAAAADIGDDGGDAGAAEGGGIDEEPVEVDAFDLCEPIDAFSKVPKDFHENLASSKWKDRKDALDALFAVVNVPRIKDGPYDEIVRVFAKCMKDANIAVVTVAANCVEALAKGLRNGFAKYRSTIMSPMMERFKEKKQSVADALGAALDAVFATTNLSDCLEETLGFLAHKNPQVRLETLKFLIRCLKTTRDVPAKPEQKSIADAATKLLTEASEVTRSGGAEVLGTLMKILGERAMGPYLDGLDDIRKTKIKEYCENAEVKAKERPKPVVAPPKAAPALSKKAPQKKAPAGLKKPAAAAPPKEEAAPSPYKQVPKSKLGGPGGGLPRPGSGVAPPGSGLKLGQKKPAGPGGAAPRHPTATPQRAVVSPISGDDEPIPATPKLGFGGGRGGLASRPLGKPALATAESAPVVPTASSHGLSAIERAELDELRLEKDRLAKLTDDLRSERQKLNTEVIELQNQNAQLIEDHTRDVLSIKAKETQLVRARSDAETAEATVSRQQKEIDRLKRELSRAVRASMSSEQTLQADTSGNSVDGGIYQDGGSSNGLTRPGMSGLGRSGSGATADSARPRSFMASPSEEKENNAAGDMGFRRKVSPPMGSNMSSGRASPTRPNVGSRTTSAREGGEVNGSGAGSAEPAENWKRAAEVTSALKARIEQMKVCSHSLFGSRRRNTDFDCRLDKGFRDHIERWQLQ